jgi:RHS repeat-associated protein
MAGISSKAAGKLENRHKFNDGTELTSEFDLSLYETPCRGYDPQVGRFWQIDPYAEDFDSWTPYNFAENNPIAFNDPTGLSKQGVGFEEDEKADESLPEVVVRPSTKKMTAIQKDNFYARSLRYDESSGSYKPHISSNYDAATQNFLSSYHRMKQREHEFDQGVSTVVQEGILFAVPWGRVVKGFAWAYKAAKARQIVKSGGIIVGDGGQYVSAMNVVREINKGEKVADLIELAQSRTMATGLEHAIVKLGPNSVAPGARVLVSGGPHGITFSAGEITTLFGHTHPYVTGASKADFQALRILNQSKQYIIEGYNSIPLRINKLP